MKLATYFLSLKETTEVDADEDDGVEASPELVEPTNNICGGGAGTELVVDPSHTASHVSAQPDPYHSTQWSHSPVLVTQQPSVMAPSVSATTGVIAMTTAQVERSQGFTDSAYYSTFTKQRPLQEIVSSLQGSYNFLQESQIDLEGEFSAGYYCQHLGSASISGWIIVIRCSIIRMIASSSSSSYALSYASSSSVMSSSSLLQVNSMCCYKINILLLCKLFCRSCIFLFSIVSVSKT